MYIEYNIVEKYEYYMTKYFKCLFQIYNKTYINLLSLNVFTL